MLSSLCEADVLFEEEDEEDEEVEEPDDLDELDDLVVSVPLVPPVVAFSPRESFRPGWISDGSLPMTSRLSW